MRAIMILATTALIALPMAATAQSAAEKPAAAPAEPAAGQSQSTVKSLNIVDISELPPQTQSKVNEVAAKATDADRKKMQQSIDSSPQIKKALAAKGLTSAQVIVANLDPNGALTLVTKKAA